MENANPLHILFVEDVPSDALLAEIEIRKGGLEFSSLRVDTRDTFIKALEEFRPDIIVSDYSMPEFDGMQALELLLEFDARIPFILLTGSINEETAVKCLKAGASDYVIKQHMKRLPFAVKEALEQKKTRGFKQEAERALRESEKKFRGVVETALEGVWFLDRQFKTIEVNRAVEDMLGYSSQELIGRPFIDLLLDEDRSAQAQEFLRRAGGMSGQYERRILCKNGEIKWVFLSAKAVMDADGKFAGSFAMVTDITERKLAEKQISLLAHTVRSVAECVSITDLNGTILFANEAFLKTYGYDGQEILGKNIAVVRSPSNPPDITTVIHTATLAGGWHGELLNRSKDGREFPVSLSTSFVRDDSGQPIALVGVASDITERKQAEKLTEALYEISKAVYSTDNLNELFQHIHRVLSGMLQTNNLFIALLADDGESLVFPYEVDEYDTGISPAIKVDDSRSLSVEVFKTKRPLLLDEAELVDRYATGRNKIWGTAPKCWLGVPLIVGDKVIGVMAVQDYHRSGVYGGKDVALFESAAGQIAVAIDRKRAEDALRESEYRTRTFLDSTSDMAFLKDDKFRHILANRALCKFYGKTEKEIQRKKDFDLMNEEAALRCRQTDEQALLANALTISEEYIGDRCYESVKFPVTIEKGKVGVGGYIRDITERREAEEALRKAEQQFRLVWENSADGMRLTNEEGQILLVNEAFCRMVGKGQSELEGKSLAVIYGKERQDHVARRHQERFASRSVETHFEGELNLWNGRNMWVEVTNSFLESKEQQPLLLGIFRDITERKRAEEDLHRLLAWQDAIFEGSRDAIFVSDADSRLVSVNQAACRLTGYTKEELLQMRIPDLHQGEDLGAYFEFHDKIMKGEEILSEAKLRQKDGKRIDTEFNNKKVMIGGVTYMHTTAREITERKQAEDALKHEKALMDALMDNIPDSIYFKDRQSKLVRINRKMMRSLNLDTLSQAIGKNDVELYGEEFGGNTLAADRKLMESGEPIISLVENRQMEDGRTNWTLTTKVPLRDASGQITGLVGITREINDLMKTQEALRLQGAALEAAANAIVITDCEGIIEWVNPAFVALTGFTMDESIGKNPRELVKSGKHDQVFYKDLWDKILAGETWRGQLINRRKDGSFYTEEQTITPVRNADGKISHFIAIKEDITDRKRAEEALRTSESQLSSAVTMAHLGHWEYDVASDLFTFNDHLYAMFRTTAGQVGGYTMSSSQYAQRFVHPDDMPLVGIEIRKALETNDPHYSGQLEHRIIYADGETGFVTVRIFVVKDDQGRTTRTYGVNQDITERKRAEETLRVSEEKYRRIFENVQDVYYESAIDGTILEVSPSIEILSKGQYHREDLVGNSMYDFYADVAERQALLAALQSRGRVTDFEIKLTNRDGSQVQCSITAFLRTDDQGRPERLIGSLNDITERKHAEEILKQERNLLRTLIDSLPDSVYIYVKDRESRYVINNLAHLRSLGATSQEEVVGKRSFDFFEADQAAGFFEDEQEVIRSGEPLVDREEITHDKALGEPRWHLTTKVPLRDSAGNIFGLVGMSRDITESKKADLNLRLSEQRFHSVWDNSADGMRLTDREGRIVDANPAFCRLVKMSREELVGKVFSNAYQRQGANDDLSLYQKRFDAGETLFDLFGSAILWNGDPIALHISSSYIDTTGQDKLLLSLIRDVTEQKKAEKRLEEERNLLRTIIDAIPDEIAVKDTERKFIVVNSGTVIAFKKASADEIIGKKDEDLIPKHIARDWVDVENAVLAGREHFIEKTASKTNPQTGEIERSLLVSKTPLKDHDGKIIGVVGINRDITALKRVEELLEKERTLLVTLIENIPDEVCLKDLRHRYLMANRASLKALGVTSLKALIGKTDQDFVPEGFAQEHFEEEDAILDSGEPLINRERIQIDPKTGQIERCLLTTKVPVKDSTGKAIGILVVNRNITERKKAEEALRASEEKFRALFEESKDLVYFSTAEGKLLDINAAGIELLGYASGQEILEIDLTRDAYADAENKKRFDAQMEEQGFVKDFEVALRRKDGEKLTVLETATAVRDRKGKVVQYRGIMRDVTKQRLLEQRFFQAQKMDSIGTLAGGIAHDFNNILGIILGHLALLERTRDNAAQFEESVFSINKAVERGASLVRQILTFARKTGVQLEAVNLNSAVKELAKMLEETFPKTMTVTLQLDKTIPLISMDPTQLHQTLLNLCVNARDAMQGRGTLSMKTRLVSGRDVSSRFPKAGAGHYVRLSVADTGAGMDEETKRRIFEPFFTTKEQGKGTGLGLAVVYGVLEAHNGFVDVESELGAGTKFDLFLPVPEGILAPTEERPKIQDDIPRGTETILVVEDEDILRDLLVKLLEMQGYKVIAASDGDEAVRCYNERAGEIDLVLSDMGLPKRTGWDAVRAMREISEDVRALLASGYIDPVQKSEILKSGVCGFIQKPYRMEEVLKAVREALDQKE